jgi:hypothetical protein
MKHLLRKLFRREQKPAKVEPLATSGQIPESLEEAVSLARASGIIEQIGRSEVISHYVFNNDGTADVCDYDIDGRITAVRV